MSELCEKHSEGYEPLKLGILTPLCPLCLQAENKRMRDALQWWIKVNEGAPNKYEWAQKALGE